MPRHSLTRWNPWGTTCYIPITLWRWIHPKLAKFTLILMCYIMYHRFGQAEAVCSTSSMPNIRLRWYTDLHIVCMADSANLGLEPSQNHTACTLSYANAGDLSIDLKKTVLCCHSNYVTKWPTCTPNLQHCLRRCQRVGVGCNFVWMIENYRFQEGGTGLLHIMNWG
jgi:hypothetical protein